MLTRSRPAASNRMARFLVSYIVGGREYNIVLPGESASHVRAKWDRSGSIFVSARECDSYGIVK